jgi:hypothetical protein
VRVLVVFGRRSFHLADPELTASLAQPAVDMLDRPAALADT